MANKLLLARFTTVLAVLFLLSACSNKEKLVGAEGNPKGSSAFDMAFFEAQRAKAVGDEEKAYLAFTKCIELDDQNAVSYYELSRIAFLQNNSGLAVEYINKAVSLDDENRWYRAARAEYLLNFGELEAALKDNLWITKRDDATVDEYYQLINNYIFLQRPQEAIAAYTAMENRFGHNEETSLQKLDLLQKIGSGEEVLQELNTLLEKDPNEILWIERKVQVLQSLGRGDEAFSLLEQMAAASPNNGPIHLELAAFYHRQGKKEAALQALNIGISSNDASYEAKQNALLKVFPPGYLKVENKEEVSAFLDLLREKHKTNELAHAISGDYYTQMGMYSEAQAAYSEALTIKPSQFELWMQLCSIDIELQDWSALELHSSETILSFPNQPQTYLWKGIAQQQLDNHAAAIKTLKSGEVLVFGDVFLSSQFAGALGESYHQLKDWSNSDKWFEKAISLNGNDASTLNNYAYYLSLRKDQLEKAAKYSLRANELSPASATFEDTYAWVLFVKGDYTEALKWIEKALQHGGDQDGVVVEHYADILYHLDNKAAALEQWEAAKKIGPGNPVLDRKIADKTYYAE